MSTKESIPTGIKRTVALMVETILIVSSFTLTAFAAPAKTEVPERVYEFGKRFNITMIIIAIIAMIAAIAGPIATVLVSK